MRGRPVALRSSPKCFVAGLARDVTLMVNIHLSSEVAMAWSLVGLVHSATNIVSQRNIVYTGDSGDSDRLPGRRLHSSKQ